MSSKINLDVSFAVASETAFASGYFVK